MRSDSSEGLKQRWIYLKPRTNIPGNEGLALPLVFDHEPTAEEAGEFVLWKTFFGTQEEASDAGKEETVRRRREVNIERGKTPDGLTPDNELWGG